MHTYKSGVITGEYSFTPSTRTVTIAIAVYPRESLAAILKLYVEMYS